MRSLLLVLAATILTASAALAAGEEKKATELARVAKEMPPGTWAELKCEGYSGELIQVQSHHILEYSDTAVWDPKSEQVLFVGQGHYSAVKFIAYSAAENRWRLMPTPSWWSGDAATGKGPIGHAYNNNALDPVRGRLYLHQSATRLVHAYDIAGGKWETLPEIAEAATGHGTAIAWFPERKGLLRVYAGTIHFFDEAAGQWSVWKEKVPMGPYHNLAKYNPIDKSMIVGAGNGSRTLQRIDAEGNIDALPEAPLLIRISSTVVSVDPVSGDLLVLNMEEKNKFWCYDMAQKKWRQLADAPLTDGVAAPIATHGVTMYLAHRPAKVYLYKHGK